MRKLTGAAVARWALAVLLVQALPALGLARERLKPAGSAPATAAASRAEGASLRPPAGAPRRIMRYRRYTRDASRVPQISRAARGRRTSARGMLYFFPPYCSPARPWDRACRPAARPPASDDFVEALVEAPSPRTRPVLDRYGIPAIDDVPPIVIITPERRP